MNCHELAARIERFQPGALPRDVARCCLLLANLVEDIGVLDDDRRLCEAWHDVGLRLQAASDQHAAMAEELDSLSRLDPSKFAMEQVRTLIRAIKVQSQVLQLYIGEVATEAG